MSPSDEGREVYSSVIQFRLFARQWIPRLLLHPFSPLLRGRGFYWLSVFFSSSRQSAYPSFSDIKKKFWSIVCRGFDSITWPFCSWFIRMESSRERYLFFSPSNSSNFGKVVLLFKGKREWEKKRSWRRIRRKIDWISILKNARGTGIEHDLRGGVWLRTSASIWREARLG